MRTLKACAWSLVLGALCIPALAVSVLMLPWIPLVGRAAEFVGRLGAQWMGVEIPPRRSGRWFDWQQFYHLLLQLLICVACFVNWVSVGFVAGVLVIAPFIPQAEFNAGEWTTDNRPLIFVVCWLAAAVLFVLLVVLNRLLVKASISLTRLALSPSAQELAASRATLIDAPLINIAVFRTAPTPEEVSERLTTTVGDRLGEITPGRIQEASWWSLMIPSYCTTKPSIPHPPAIAMASTPF